MISTKKNIQTPATAQTILGSDTSINEILKEANQKLVAIENSMHQIALRIGVDAPGVGVSDEADNVKQHALNIRRRASEILEFSYHVIEFI